MFTETSTRSQRALWTRRELQAGLTISVVGQQPGGAAWTGSDELADFEGRTFRDWDPASLGDVQRAITRRRRELGERL